MGGEGVGAQTGLGQHLNDKAGGANGAWSLPKLWEKVGDGDSWKQSHETHLTPGS